MRRSSGILGNSESRDVMIRPRLGATFAQPREAAALHESRHAEDDTGGGVGYDYRTLI
jgi:hypothetical protein